jgi:nucleoside-diphosphate-sugar epimerase
MQFQTVLMRRIVAVMAILEVGMAKVLILGASGAFGSSADAAFRMAGWEVARYARGTDMAAAAIGAAVIVNALNPPGYHDWARLIPEITTHVLAAAKASGARVIVPGNVYPYGMAPAPWGPETPYQPVARKGAIRAAMEARYRDAPTPTIILRAGDFLHEAQADLVMNRVILAALRRGRIITMGDPHARHAFAYLPDLAAAAVGLAGHQALPHFADIPFAGDAFSMTGLQGILAVMLGKPLRIGRFAWWQIKGLSPFWELARELLEMRYLYSHPHWLDPAPLARLLPDLRLTPLEVVMGRYLAMMGLQGSAISTQTSLWREAV